jgi:antitoxin ParD1/3/4
MTRVIRETVADGEYASTSEAIRDTIRVWHRTRTEDTERLKTIRSKLRQSIDDPRPSLTEPEVDARLAIAASCGTPPLARRGLRG